MDLNFFEAVAQTPLLQRALIAGALSGVCCACLSPLVVLRRMAFAGDGLAHAAFGGIGLALFIFSNAKYDDWRVQAVTLLFSLGLGLALGVVTRRSGPDKLGEDSAIGVAFSVSMALGALFIALRQQHSPQYVPSMDTYLFGSLLNIGSTEIIFLLVVATAVVATLLLLQKELLFYSFDARLAEVSGMRVGFIHYLFILLLVLTIVISSRIVGIILVSSSLIIPGVTALKLCTRLPTATLVAGLIGVLTFEAGMYASFLLKVHPGSPIVLLQFALLIGAGFLQWLRKPRALAVKP